MSNKWRVTYCFSLMVFAFACMGCGEEPLAEMPDGLIAEEQYVNLYADVHVLEAALKQKLLKGHDTDEEVAAYYHKVFTDHGVTQELYEQTRAWYTAHPRRMEAMLAQAQERIATLQAERGTPDSKEDSDP